VPSGIETLGWPDFEGDGPSREPGPIGPPVISDPVIRKEDRSRLVVIKRDNPTLSQLIEPVVLREPLPMRSVLGLHRCKFRLRGEFDVRVILNGRQIEIRTEPTHRQRADDGHASVERATATGTGDGQPISVEAIRRPVQRVEKAGLQGHRARGGRPRPC